MVTYNNYIKNTLVPNYAIQGRKISTVDQYSNFLKNGTIDASLYANGINHPNATGYDRMAQTWFAGIQALGTIATPPALRRLRRGCARTDRAAGRNSCRTDRGRRPVGC